MQVTPRLEIILIGTSILGSTQLQRVKKKKKQPWHKGNFEFSSINHRSSLQSTSSDVLVPRHHKEIMLTLSLSQVCKDQFLQSLQSRPWKRTTAKLIKQPTYEIQLHSSTWLDSQDASPKPKQTFDKSILRGHPCRTTTQQGNPHPRDIANASTVPPDSLWTAALLRLKPFWTKKRLNW